MHFIAPLGAAGAARAFTPAEREILDTVNQKVAGEASLDDLLDFLFDNIPELYPCDRIGLAFLDDEDRRIVSQKTKALYEPVLLGPGYAEDLARSSLRRVIDRNCSRIIYDLPRYLEENPRSHSSQLLVREGVQSSLTCPLTVNERQFGVIFLSSREHRAYTPYHVQLWMAIAERLAQAVEKVWRIEQLQAANKAYLEMLAFVSHELKNPIASMMTDARVLADGYLGDLQPRQAQKLERLIGKGNHLLELIRVYLDLARMEGGDLILHPRLSAFVEEVVDPAVDLIQPQLQARHMVLERLCPDGPEPIQCDPDLLQIVLVNLLGNAVKYGLEGGRIRLTVERLVDELRLSVWNQGPGFPPEERSRLFRKFSRLHAPELRERKGSGVGLYTTWRIVNMHKGHVDARSEYGSWAEFVVEIPQPIPAD
jgi:signal transduction histidine kinase